MRSNLENKHAMKNIQPKPYALEWFKSSYLVPREAKQKAKLSGLETRNQDSDEKLKNQQLLELCMTHWNNMSDFRDRRMRSRNYERGDQWYELIETASGEIMTEENLILDQGRLPLKQNLIRKLVRNLMGQYRNNPGKTIVMSRTRDDQMLSEMMSNALQAAKDLNEYTEIDAQAFHEHILGGMPVQKVGYKYWKTLNRSDMLIQNIHPNRFFYNTDASDIRGLDMNLVGEMIDTDVDSLIAQFARTKEDEEWIKNIYSYRTVVTSSVPTGMSDDYIDAIDFYTAPEGQCRIFEIWQLTGEWRLYAHDYSTGEYRFYPLHAKKALETENQNRIIQAARYGILPEEVPMIETEEKFERVWYCKILTPYGQVLFEGETPYEHEDHPYILNFYPFIDGEVWGMVEDIIDQQRQINRLFSMLDYIMGTDAKNTLVVHEDAISGKMNLDELKENYVKVGGVLLVKGKPGTPLPQVLTSNSRSITASEILSYQMQLINELSGINPAMQGQSATGGKAASLYQLEAQNSAINIRDIMASFQSFIRKRDMKIIKTIKQFYSERIYLATSGKSYSKEAAVYDPMAIKDMDFTNVVVEGLDTPLYRQVMDETLMELLRLNAIDAQIFLENCSLPYADKILEGIRKRTEELQRQMAGSGTAQALPPQSGSVPAA